MSAHTHVFVTHQPPLAENNAQGAVYHLAELTRGPRNLSMIRPQLTAGVA